MVNHPKLPSAKWRNHLIYVTLFHHHVLYLLNLFVHVSVKQFENEMTPEEKARLYKAIDYQENAPATIFPEEFVDKSLSFLLR